MRDLLSKAAKYRAEARRRKLWQRAVSLLACVVLLFTTYAQILPAITLEQTERLLDCRYAVHEHTAACYDGDELICGQADFVVHTHDKNCYDPSGRLVCPLPEIKTHTHTEACYASLPAESEQEQTPADGAARLICGQKEAEGHTHTDECYETEQVLVCGLEATEGHTHTDACYEKQLTCTETETEGHTHDEDCYKTTKTLLCINTDTDHIHSEACYDIEQTLICTEDEVPAHEHDDTCYEEVLICGQEEAAAHEHTEACYEERRTLICEKEETEGHTHSEECYAAADEEQLEPEETPAPSAEDEAQERELICGQEEIVLHTHSKRCYDETGALICGQLEVLEHQHQDGCFQSAGEGGSETPDQPEEEETPASRLLEAVKGELGYTEDEDGHTLYGEHYARGDEPWNVMFVAYCLEKAEITAMPSAEDVLFDCDLWRAALQAQELYQSTLTYTPAPGELVFLDEDGDNIADLVAVVEKVTDERVEVIAGDLSDGVRRADYSLDDDSILGYAQLPEDEEKPVEDDDPKQEEGPKDDTGEETPDKDEPADDEKEEEDAPAQGLAGRVLAAAVGQIGYTAAEDGTTLYGEFYDRADAPWNVMFAAYCLEQAGVAELPLAAAADFACDDWLAALTGAELFREGGAYTPAPGDLAFFDLDEDGAADFVAIVEKIAANRLHLIAGDVAAGCVKRSSWALDDAKLVGYVQLAEQADEQETPAEETKLYQTAEDSPVQATVTFAKESKISKDAVLTVSPITETLLLADPEEDGGKASYALLKEQAEQAVGKQAVGKQAAQFALYDISFYTPDEEYIPVTESATVSLRLEGDAFKAAEQIAVLHYPAGQEEPTVLENVVWETDEDGITTVTFQTDGFSVFGIMALAEDELTAQGGNNSFTLTYNGYAITFNLVDDNEEKELKSTEMANITAEEAQQYKFKDLAPNVEGYTYSHAVYSDKTVASVATTGFSNGWGTFNSAFQFYIDDPIKKDQWYSRSENCVVKLVYTQNADNLDGRTFAIVNHRSNGDYALTASSVDNVYGVAGLASQIVTLIQNSEDVYQVFEDGTAQSITRWTLHRQSDGTYIISTTVPGTSTQAEEKYLRLCESLSVTNPGCGSLGLTDEENASHITVESKDNGRMILKYQETYISLDVGSGNFWSSNQEDDNVKQYFCEIVSDAAAIITTGVNHPSSIINLFDYWLEDQKAPDNTFLAEQLDKGINENHALKFIKDADGVKDSNGNSVPIDSWNKWTGRTSTNDGGIIYKDLVESKLGKNGYPVLTKQIDPSQESLAYLFDPDTQNPYRADYCNVSGLLQVDADGFYYYNSQKNFAEYDELNNRFILYNKWGVLPGGSSPKGQFFPFNSMEKVKDIDSRNALINHYFGLTLTTRFAQQYEGHTTSTKTTKTVFNFAGDDDVWIFIDNVLVADLGGNHDAAKVSIDFSTGEIVINDGSVNGSRTTLKEAFKTALGEENLDSSDWKESTFADNTYHVLKFFYLERGNTDSNLSLQYNLTEIPITSIYKVNQYGEAIPGAKFEVFPSNEGYTDTAEYSVYSGTTDEKGEMVFTGADGMPYTLNEMEEQFGQYFVLKETEPPANYRLVSDEIHLYIQNGLLLCENTYESGVWAATTLQVAAPATLKKAADNGTINYYSLDNKNGVANSVTGTLFAVVLKYTGDGENGLNNQANWTPVSGTNQRGYAIHTAGTDFIAAAIDAAKEQSSLTGKDSVCFSLSAGGAMQLTMENLPGDIRTYYRMLDENNKGDTKYTIAYYWTKASDLSGATNGNTYRVDAESSTYAFDRAFGATVEVPNLFNRLFAQKFNEDNELVNGASFAMYTVEEIDSGVYYVAADKTRIHLDEDADADNCGTASVDGTGGYTYSIDSNTGKITVKGAAADEPSYLIEPYLVAMTLAANAYNNASKEDGTATFTGIQDGTYYLREIGVPTGYFLNPTEVMVLVKEDAVYANAGTIDDNVRVGRGPGYLVSTLSKFASQGAIDNTLSWIYEQMRISEESTTFAAYEEDAWKQWNYLKEGNAVQTIYLEYAPQDSNTLFNYTVNKGRYADPDSVNRRLYTDVGWSYYELYQDYIYGKDNAGTADYSQVVDEKGKPLEIANLFSRSIYVQVTDEKISGTLEISKILEGVSETVAEEAEFKFTVTLDNDEPEDKTYTYTVYNVAKDENGVLRRTPAKTKNDEDGNPVPITDVLSSGETITLKSGQVAVIEKIPAGTKYTVTEDAASAASYMVSSIRDRGKEIAGTGMGSATFAQTVEGTLYWNIDDNGKPDTVSTVEYTNTRLTELTINKVDSTGRFNLSGAGFVLYKTEDAENKYYRYTPPTGDNSNKGVTWEALEENGNNKETYMLTTNEKGLITLHSIEEGTYYLEEIVAPAGYYPLDTPICITVSDGKMEISDGPSVEEMGIKVKGDGLILEIPNRTGYEMPQTGGSGHIAYTFGGTALLIGASVAYALYKRKKGKNRDCD